MKLVISRNTIGRCFLSVAMTVGLGVQLFSQSKPKSSQPVEMASLRPQQELLWKKVSPTASNPDGAVLYQIIFRNSATPGSIPKIANNYTLTNSLLRESGNLVIISGTANMTGFQLSTGAGTGLVLTSDASGNGTWQPAGSSNVSITAGTGLTATPVNPITGTGTINIANGGVTTVQMNSGSAANGQVLTANGAGGVSWQTLTSTITNAWNLGGNTSTGCTTSPCASFIGTTDNAAFEIRVNNARTFRFESAATTVLTGTSSNVIGGFSGNTVTAGAGGVTIAGGGGSGNGYAHLVTDDFGTIGGGVANQAGNNSGTTADAAYATVAGGGANIASGGASAIGGGLNNTASGAEAAIAGGNFNSASGLLSAVMGGSNNFAIGVRSSVAGGGFNSASGTNAIVLGGAGSTASGDFSLAAGTNANTNFHKGTFVWGDRSTTNINILASADNQFVARASGGFQLIAGIDGSGNPDPNKTVSIAANSGIITFASGQTFPASGLPAWLSNGNAGTGCTTTPCADFIGTTDNTSLEVRVNGQRAFRIEPQIDSSDSNSPAPNIIGGFGGNSVSSGLHGATIAGGGELTSINLVSASFGTIGGGGHNTAAGFASTVAGGSQSTAGGDYSTVAGGVVNAASGIYSTIGGGSGNVSSANASIVTGGISNTASGNSSVVAGGSGNTASGFISSTGGGNLNVASGLASTVPGGFANNASGDYSFAAGRHANTNLHKGAFVWGDDSTGTVIQATADNQFMTRSVGGFQFVAGIDGSGNPDPAKTVSIAADSGVITFVSGQTFPASGLPSWSLSGNSGTGCTTSPCFDFVGTTDNVPFEIHVNNQRALRIEPQIGVGNVPTPNIIAGFRGNSVANGSHASIIAGGGESMFPNSTLGNVDTVGGGEGNVAGPGYDATVGGGFQNTASGIGAMVVGGNSNTASGDYSFAAGDQADTNSHRGAFVWADATGSAVTATADNQFVARSSGGVIFYSSSNLSSGVQLTAGGGSWSSVSDRNMKENFAPIDSNQFLARVLALPITTWNYKSQAASIRHIGPMAQDFYSAFNVGEDNKHITDIDEGGVALAAIQALNHKLEAEVTVLRAQLQDRDRLLTLQQEQIDSLQRQMLTVTARIEIVEGRSSLRTNRPLLSADSR